MGYLQEGAARLGAGQQQADLAAQVGGDGDAVAVVAQRVVDAIDAPDPAVFDLVANDNVDAINEADDRP